jgi:hypothetical protein
MQALRDTYVKEGLNTSLSSDINADYRTKLKIFSIFVTLVILQGVQGRLFGTFGGNMTFSMASRD